MKLRMLSPDPSQAKEETKEYSTRSLKDVSPGFMKQTYSICFSLFIFSMYFFPFLFIIINTIILSLQLPFVRDLNLLPFYPSTGGQ